MLSFFLSYLLLYKYATLAIAVYAAAVIAPLPTNAMLLAVGAFASQGYFNFWWSLVIAVSANTAGDLTDYFLARHYGERLTRALHLHRFEFFEQLREELRTDAAITVFTTRFAGSLSPVASFLSGLVRVPFRTFFWCDIAGNLIEPGAALVIGYTVGSYWTDFSGPMEIVAGIVAVGIVLFVLFRISRRIARRHHAT
jgi:undecaprenyl-diphosphatase